VSSLVCVGHHAQLAGPLGYRVLLFGREWLAEGCPGARTISPTEESSGAYEE